MNETDLRKLSSTVEYILDQESFSRTVDRLSDELARSSETFVWATVDFDSIPCELPEGIKSAWIFHLRRNVPSGAHYHPNSVQHMALVRGRGASDVAGEQQPMILFTSSAASPSDKWLVIGQGVAHQFIPDGEDMTVVSFHTCDADDLEEIECRTGGTRHYEGLDA